MIREIAFNDNQSAIWEITASQIEGFFFKTDVQSSFFILIQTITHDFYVQNLNINEAPSFERFYNTAPSMENF